MLWHLINKELKGYFVTPIAYVFITIFLLFNGLLTFTFGNFYERNIADLYPFFQWHIWLYLFLAPAITMRLWAEEKKTGTIELLLTLPCHAFTLVLAKFFASWLFCGLCLLLTLPYWGLVSWLGDPDHGIIFTSFIGSFITAGVYLAIGCAMSMTTRNQIVAYILSLLFGFVFTAGGLDLIAQAFEVIENLLNINIGAFMAFVAVMQHFQSFLEGAPSLANILFMSSLIIFMLVINYWLLQSLHQRASSLIMPMILPLMVVFFSINYLSSHYLQRHHIDMSENQLFSISDGTKSYLQRMEQPLDINIYYSQHHAADYPQIAHYAQYLRSFLNHYQSYSNGMISVHWNVPKIFSKIEDDAIAQSIEGLPINDLGDKFYFGLSIKNIHDDYRAMAFLDPARQHYFEYELTRMIDQLLKQRQKLKIGMASALNFTPPNSNPYQQQQQSWYLKEFIGERYDIIDINDDIPHDLSALIMIAPTKLPPQMLENAKTYLNNGGNIIFFADPYDSTARVMRQPITPESPESLKIFQSIINDYSINYQPNHVMLDRSIALRTQSDHQQLRVISKPAWLGIGKAQLNNRHVISADLLHIRMLSAGYWEFDNNNRNIIPLVSVGQQAKIIDDVSQLVDNESLLRDYKGDNKQYHLILHAQKENQSGGNQGRILLVSDADMLHDAYWVQRQNFFGSNIVTPMADNGALVMNILDYISGDNDLIAIRTRNNINRPFEIVENIRSRAEVAYLQQEQQLNDQLNQAEQRLAQLIQGGNNLSLLLNEQQQVEIDNTRDDILNYRQKLRQVQAQLRDDINQLGHVLRLLFIVILPFSVFIISLLLWRKLS